MSSSEAEGFEDSQANVAADADLFGSDSENEGQGYAKCAITCIRG